MKCFFVTLKFKTVVYLLVCALLATTITAAFSRIISALDAEGVAAWKMHILQQAVTMQKSP